MGCSARLYHYRDRTVPGLKIIVSGCTVLSSSEPLESIQFHLESLGITSHRSGTTNPPKEHMALPYRCSQPGWEIMIMTRQLTCIGS